MQIEMKGTSVPESIVKPIRAVVFYSDDGTRVVTATIHEMTATAKGSTAGAGRPLTVESLTALSKMAQASCRRRPEILPANVLVATDDLLVWWRPAGGEHLSFDVDWHEGQPGRERLQGVTHFMPLPPLVFLLSRNQAASGVFQGVYVFALGVNERPTAETPMFVAPLLNINDNGNVCWGNGESPRSRNVTDIAAWERCFFTSTFTHVNQASPLKSEKPYQWIADFCESKATQFPLDQLKPMKKNLGDLIAHHAKVNG